MFIPDPNFSIPDPWSEFFPSRIRIKEFKYLTRKIVSKFSEIWSELFIPDPDPDFLPIPDPGSRGQQSTGSRIRNTVNIMKIVKVTANKSGTGGPSMAQLTFLHKDGVFLN